VRQRKVVQVVIAIPQHDGTEDEQNQGQDGNDELEDHHDPNNERFEIAQLHFLGHKSTPADGLKAFARTNDLLVQHHGDHGENDQNDRGNKGVTIVADARI